MQYGDVGLALFVWLLYYYLCSEFHCCNPLPGLYQSYTTSCSCLCTDFNFPQNASWIMLRLLGYILRLVKFLTSAGYTLFRNSCLISFCKRWIIGTTKEWGSLFFPILYNWAFKEFMPQKKNKKINKCRTFPISICLYIQQIPELDVD